MKLIRLRPFPPARPALKALQRLFESMGFQLIDIRPTDTGIKDAEYYKPMFNPWLTPEWKERLHADDPRSVVTVEAKYNLHRLATAAARRCSGGIAECGVYKGGTARILAETHLDRPVHLFDTFAGMPETDPVKDLHKAGDFADTSLESVRLYLSEFRNVTFVPGLIPESLQCVAENVFSFVHIDLDIYSSIMAACGFFLFENAGGRDLALR